MATTMDPNERMTVIEKFFNNPHFAVREDDAALHVLKSLQLYTNALEPAQRQGKVGEDFAAAFDQTLVSFGDSTFDQIEGAVHKLREYFVKLDTESGDIPTVAALDEQLEKLTLASVFAGAEIEISN